MTSERRSFSSGVRLRDTHRNLYRMLMTVAVFDALLGLNFLIFTPTFEQFDVPKNAIGACWLALGLTELVFLKLRPNLRRMRITGWVGIALAGIWGIGTTQTVWEGKSSGQLFLLYGLRVGLVIWLLREPYRNEATANGVVKE